MSSDFGPRGGQSYKGRMPGQRTEIGGVSWEVDIPVSGLFVIYKHLSTISSLSSGEWRG